MPIMTDIRRKLPLLKPQTPSNDTTEPNRSCEQTSPGAAVVELPIEDIIPNRAQPRTTFNQNAIVRLADSIRRYGILQPLTVRKVLLPAQSNRKSVSGAVYELVAGERRLRAAKLAALSTVPCIIINTDDATSAELAIIENLLREDLNMFEQAEAFQRLIGEFHLTQEEAARRVSMSQSAIANKLRLLRLLPDERARIVESGLTERHARALLKLPDPALRGDVLQHILDRKLNVSASEAYIDRLLTEISRYERQSSASHAGFGTKALSESPFLPDLPQNLAVLGPNDATVKEQPMDEPLAPSDDELPLAIRSVMARRDNRFKGSIKDLRLFYNSIQNAVNILESTGIAANIERTESEQHVCVTITLSKAASGEK